MSKILVVHHLEPCWESGYVSNGRNFYDLEYEVYKWIRRFKPDQVILTRIESSICDYEEYEKLPEYVDRVHQYGYGWDKQCARDLRKTNEKVVKGGCHSDYVWVPKWIQSLKGNSVRVMGAFRGECLDDMEVALNASKVKFKFIEHLCIG